MIFLWIALFVGAVVFLTGQPKNSIVTICYVGIMLVVWLFGMVIQVRERRGLSTLPGRDFRSHADDVPENPPGRYRLSDDGEIVEIPEKPKKDLSRN